MYFSQFRRLEVWVQGDSRPAFSLLGWELLTVSSSGGVGQGAPPDFFNRGTNPINEDRASWPTYPPKAPHAKSITLGIRFLIYVFCGYTYIESIVLKGLPQSLCPCVLDLYLPFFFEFQSRLFICSFYNSWCRILSIWILLTLFLSPTLFTQPWWSERLRAGGEDSDKGWGGQLASPIQ